MGNPIYFLPIVAICCAYAQSVANCTDIEKPISHSTYMIKVKPGKFDYAHLGVLYRITVTRLQSGEYEIKYDQATATISKISEPNFVSAVMSVLPSTLDEADRRTIATQIYEQVTISAFTGELDTRIQQPIEQIGIGNIKFRRNSKVPLSIANLADQSRINFIFFILNNHTYTYPPTPRFLTLVDAQIGFDDGGAKDIVVNGIDGLSGETLEFRNSIPVPIHDSKDIADFNSPDTYFLYCKRGDTVLRLDLASVMRFSRKVLSGSASYFPAKRVVSLDGNTAEVPLFKRSFLDNFDVRLYTDVTGTRADQPNGLLQFDARYNMLFTAKPSNEQIVYIHELSPFLRFPKIEDKLKKARARFIPRDSGGKSIRYLPTLDILKYANLDFGLDINAFTVFTQDRKWRLDIRGGLFRTSIDSIERSINGESTLVADTNDVLSWYIEPTLRLRVIDSDLFEVDLGYGLLMTQLIDNSLAQTYDLQPDSIGTISSSIFDFGNIIHVGQAGLSIHPKPSEQETAIFLRATAYLEPPLWNLSLQLGYATPITKIFRWNEDPATE